MAKKETVIDSPASSTKDGGLLSILTEAPKDNLLSEAMQQKGSTNFNKATGESYQRLDELRKEEALSQKQIDNQESEKPEPIEEEKEQKPSIEEEEKPEPIAAKEDESKWYALNEEQQRYAQRQEMLERELLQERQSTRQALEQLKPQQQESYDFDFTSPEGIKAFEERVYNRARSEFKQSQEPLLRQLAAKDFQSTTSQLAAKYEHFNKYFPQQMLQQYFQAAAQRFSINDLMALDWGKELSLAYQAADYTRLKQDYEKLTSTKAEEKKEASKEKEEQKSNLKLVPKASAKGTASKSSPNDELAEWRTNHSGRFGMEDVSANLKRKLGLG